MKSFWPYHLPDCDMEPDDQGRCSCGDRMRVEQRTGEEPI